LLSLAMLVATAQLCDEMPRWMQLAAIAFLPLLFLLLAALMGGVHPGAWLRALAHPLRVGERSVGARLGDTLRRMAEDLRAQDRLLRRPPRDRNPRLVGHGTLALMLYRISHWALANSQLRLAGFLWRLNTTLTGADIHPVASIGPGCLIVHPVGVVIFGRLGRGVTLYARVLVDCVDLPQQLDRAPTIGDRAELGALSAVLGPVRIADDARIVPGSLIEQPAGLAVRRSRSTA
jgi:serine acetyltransferase